MPVIADTMTSKINSPQSNLKCASEELDNQLQSDREYPDLGAQLGVIGNGGITTFSGINDFDYPCIFGKQSHQHPGAAGNLLSSLKRVPIPEELFEQFEHVQANVTMGLFAEISRAWLAIDSDIYVWNFEDGSDVAYFDGLDEVILAAGLITPKPGVFHEHIRFLLCITTPFSIVVLGVGFGDEHDGRIYRQMHLQPQPLFTVPTDSVFMTSISGTWNGRIFLSGGDGCIYELSYQAQNSWFRQQCKKINHSASWVSMLVPSFVSKAFSKEDPLCQIAVDNTRQTLYGRTQRGSIQVYDLGEDGQSMRMAAALDSNSIAVKASYAAKNIDRKHFQSIIHIAPISKAESTQVHLVGITDTGVRLFFAITSPNNLDERPSMLRLVHVRLPPGFAPSTSITKPTKVHQSFYRQGTTLMIESSSDDADSLWCLSQESYPFQMTMKESQVLSMLEGKTWCVAEIPDYSDVNRIPHAFFNCSWPEPPSIVNQHVFPQRRFVLLSPKGSHILTTLRPVEQLRQLLLVSGGGESEDLEMFFKFYGVTQACAMCLVLICQSPEMEREIIDWAVHAFFRYDNSPNTVANTSVQTADPAATVNDATFVFSGPAQGGSVHGSYLASPIQMRQNTNQQQNLASKFSTSTPAVRPTVTTKNYSGKHTSIALYLARILRPIWNQPLVVECFPDGKNQQLLSQFSTDDLSWFVENLRKLRDFMDRYSNLTLHGSPGKPYHVMLTSPAAARGLSKTRDVGQDAAAIERASLIHLCNLIKMCCEVLELWRTLCDNQIECITQNLPQSVKDHFLSCSLKDFVLNGQEISAALIGCLMARYLDDHATVDAINEHLRKICPTLFSADDAVYSKANEMVNFAKTLHEREERDLLLAEAVKMYFHVPALLDLHWICKQLESAMYFDGIVELSQYVASKRDPKGVALHYYKAGQPRDDTQGHEAFIIRRDAYKCVMDTLDTLHDKCIEQHHPLPTEPGPPVQLDPNALTAEQAKQILERTLITALRSSDELFHVSLYEWLLSKDMQERLLEVTSPFLEHFIIRTAAEKHPNDIAMLDLLWKHHQKRKNYFSASKVLIGLAERESDSLTIQERIAYISRAIMCAKNSSLVANSNTEGEFLHELEEKLDVARIQFQVHEALSRVKVGGHLIQEKAEALKMLDSKLIDISQLYGDFADQFNLLECKLQILHCAGHHDQALIESIWKEIVQKEIQSQGRMTAVSQKLILIGKTYIDSQGYFPAEFLLFYLEKISCENNWDPTWVFVTFKEIGVPVKQIWMLYDKLFRSKEPTWPASARPLHLFDVISLFMRYYLDNIAIVPSSQRPAFSRLLCEACSSYLVELESMNESYRNVKNLLSRFRAIRAELKREF